MGSIALRRMARLLYGTLTDVLSDKIIRYIYLYSCLWMCDPCECRHNNAQVYLGELL